MTDISIFSNSTGLPGFSTTSATSPQQCGLFASSKARCHLSLKCIKEDAFVLTIAPANHERHFGKPSTSAPQKAQKKRAPHTTRSNMLKAPSRKDRNLPIRDPDFALNLARAVAQMGKVNSRIEALTLKLSKNANSSPASTPSNTRSSENQLANTLLEAFDISEEDDDVEQTALREQDEREAAVERAKQRAVAREKARLRFADMYRRFVQRRYPLTWELVLRQECRE